ncbi:MAG TPA: hypothetical protein HPQ04_10060 [Rhodospirillaceae bacterium]|nr:hypothetical protein [Rhodospirillaceae bacterium]
MTSRSARPFWPRPDLPAWLDYAFSRAIAVDPAGRYDDVLEFAGDLETGPAAVPPLAGRSLYERHPLRCWQLVSACLAVALLLSLVLRVKGSRVKPG